MTVLLKTRISRPKLGAQLLYRDALIQRLEYNSSKRLIIIPAASGFGKTTLVSQWLESKARKHAWISLDKDCNHFSTFLSYFVHAIDKISPGFSKNIQRYLNFQKLPEVDEITATLTNELIDFQEHFILVLDDYQWVNDLRIHHFLDELLKYPPSILHLVIISRRDPPLILGRMRLYDQMHLIRGKDLIFGADEILELSRILNKRELSPEFLQKLWQTTEGWVGGIRFLLLQGLNPRSFIKNKGSDLLPVPELTDYIMQGLTRMYPQQSLEKLLIGSILNEFNSDLINYISWTEIENIDSQKNEVDIFQDLIKSDFFIVAVGDEKEWYRFHHLFKDVLFRQLKKIKSQQQISQLHLRAANWFDQHGDFGASLKHAISSHDTAFALKIFMKYRYREMGNENWTSLSESIQLFPEEIIDNTPLVLTTKAFCEEYLSNWMEVNTLEERILELISEMKDDDPEKKVALGEIRALQSISVVRKNQDFRQATSYGGEALAILPPEDSFIKFYALLGQSIGEAYQGTDSKYISTFKKYRTHENSLIGKSRYNGALGLLSIINGNLGLIEKVAKYGIRLLESVNNEVANVAVYYYLFYRYQRNELENLLEYYQLVYKKRHSLRPFYLAQCAVIGSFVEMVYGNTEKAWEIIDEAEKYIIRVNSPDAVHFIQMGKIELAIRQGDFNLAEKLAIDMDFRFRLPTWEILSPLIVEFKLIVNRCDYEASEAKLQELMALNKSIHHNHFAVSLFTCRAGFFWKWKQKQKALDALDEAIQISKKGHYIRPFLDLGRPFKKLLIEYMNAHGSDYYTTVILDAFGKEPVPESEKTAQSIPVKSDSKKDSKSSYGLTKREKEIIIQAEKGISNKEIAQALFISELTVKKHLSNIFSKLDVKNRQSLIIKTKISNDV